MQHLFRKAKKQINEWNERQRGVKVTGEELPLSLALLVLLFKAEKRRQAPIYLHLCSVLKDRPRSKIIWEPTQMPAKFSLPLNFSFSQRAILALMLDRQLKGQQVPLVAFCQGFLTCLWIKISQEESRPEFPVIWKTAMNLKMLPKA